MARTLDSHAIDNRSQESSIMLLRQLFISVALIMAPGSVADVKAASTAPTTIQWSYEELELEDLSDYVLNFIPETEEEELVTGLAIRFLELEPTDPTPRCKYGDFFPTEGTGIKWGTCGGKLASLTICIKNKCKSWQ